MKKPGGEFCCFKIDRFIYTGIFIPSVVKNLIELFMLFSANYMPLNLILKMDLFCTLFMGLSRLQVYNLEPFQQVERSYKFKLKYSTDENGCA